jgi:hypothetical protein
MKEEYDFSQSVKNPYSPGYYNDTEQLLIEKIRSLSPEKVIEVLDFVDFLCQRDEENSLVKSASKLSENAFEKVWDNSEDAEYDQL